MGYCEFCGHLRSVGGLDVWNSFALSYIPQYDRAGMRKAFDGESDFWSCKDGCSYERATCKGNGYKKTGVHRRYCPSVRDERDEVVAYRDGFDIVVAHRRLAEAHPHRMQGRLV